jgi:hypothetical protein
MTWLAQHLKSVGGLSVKITQEGSHISGPAERSARHNVIHLDFSSQIPPPAGGTTKLPFLKFIRAHISSTRTLQSKLEGHPLESVELSEGASDAAPIF